MSVFAYKADSRFVLPRGVHRLLLALVCLVFSCLTGCTFSLVEVGGFSIRESHSYEVKDVSSLHVIQAADGRSLETCDATVILRDSQYGIGVGWYDGVTFDEAKGYLAERSYFDDTKVHDGFPHVSQEWRSISKQDVVVSEGIPGYLSKEESVAGLGTPYAYYLEVLVFPTSEDSIGTLTLVAHSLEQKDAEQELFEEVMDGLVVDQPTSLE